MTKAIEMEVEIFRIRRKKDNLFSKGGIRPRFDRRGKVWRSADDVKRHLLLLKKKGNLYIYKDCVIDKYDISETVELGVD